jgi:hypothetical protein
MKNRIRRLTHPGLKVSETSILPNALAKLGPFCARRPSDVSARTEKSAPWGTRVVGVLVLFSGLFMALAVPTAVADASSQPHLANPQLSWVPVQTPFQAGVEMATTPNGGGYWIDDVYGDVYTFGNAAFYGSVPSALGHLPAAPMAGMAATPDGKGYWLVDTGGGVYAFGDAKFFGSIPGVLGHFANAPVTGFSPTADGRGYWLVGGDGGLFAFGDATYLGSLPGLGVVPESYPFDTTYFPGGSYSNLTVDGVDGIAPTPDGKGYWMLGGDGGIFAFGDAGFYGSVPGVIGHGPSLPVVKMIPSASGHGYLMVGEDGGLYAFGDATYRGSLPGMGIAVPLPQLGPYNPTTRTLPLNFPSTTVSTMAATPDGGGYWIADSQGDVFPFGDAQYFGSVPSTNPQNFPVAVSTCPVSAITFAC